LNFGFFHTEAQRNGGTEVLDFELDKKSKEKRRKGNEAKNCNHFNSIFL
jgi:hypothetical protein